MPTQDYKVTYKNERNICVSIYFVSDPFKTSFQKALDFIKRNKSTPDLKLFYKSWTSMCNFGWKLQHLPGIV